MDKQWGKIQRVLHGTEKPSASSETGPSWKLSDADIMSVIFHDPDEKVTCYCMVNGDLYETTVTLPAFVPQSERKRT